MNFGVLFLISSKSYETKVILIIKYNLDILSMMNGHVLCLCLNSIISTTDLFDTSIDRRHTNITMRLCLKARTKDYNIIYTLDPDENARCRSVILCVGIDFRSDMST